MNGEFTAIDYDGDGLPDLLSVSGTSILVRRNVTSPGGGVAFASSATSVWTTGDDTVSAGVDNPFFKAADFNGDGRADFLVNSSVVLDNPNGSTYRRVVRHVLLSNGFGAQATDVPISTYTVSGNTPPRKPTSAI